MWRRCRMCKGGRKQYIVGFYSLSVLFLLNVIRYTYIATASTAHHALADDVISAEHPGRRLSKLSEADFLASFHSTARDIHRHDVTLDSTEDTSKRLIAHMRVMRCVRSGGVFSKCLENEYIKERKKSTADKIKDSKNAKTKKEKSKNEHAPIGRRIISETKRKVDHIFQNKTIIAPTDDPKKVQARKKSTADKIKDSKDAKKDKSKNEDAPIGRRMISNTKRKVDHIFRNKTTIVQTDDPKKVQAFYEMANHPLKVNTFQYDFVLKPKHGCDSDTFMVILVHSFHPYAERRRAIRDTWGGVAIGNQSWPGGIKLKQKLKVIFMLGTHIQPAMNSAIHNESNIFDDIIQGNFYDAYVNMTLKSLLGLKYVATHCKNVKYLLKSDDDMIINLPYLFDVLKEKNMTRGIMGPLNVGSKVYRSGKWKVNLQDYPFRYYPPYEGGSAYVISNDIVPELYNMSHYIKYFHIDDAYITGVIGKMIGVNHIKQPGFAYWTGKAPTVCDITERKIVTGTKMTPANLWNIWRALKLPKIVC